MDAKRDRPVLAGLYGATTFLLGIAVVAISIAGLAALPPDALLSACGGIALAALAGLFPLRMPGRTASVTGAEIFVFLLLLLDGPGAAALAATAEASVASLRTPQRWTNRLARPAMAALAMYACGSMFSVTVDALGGLRALGAGATLGTLLLVTFAYFATGTLLMASFVSLQEGRPVRPLAILREHDWLALAFACSASIAGAVYVAVEVVGAAALPGSVPFIAMFLSMINLLFRNAEADARIRRERLAAQEREAAEAARHTAALRASEERFHSVFTHAAVGMAMLSRDGRILRVNEALCRLLGSTEGDLVGGDFARIAADSDADLLRGEIGRLLLGATARLSVEVRCRAGGAGAVRASSNGFLSGAEDAGERCVIVQVQDASAREHAETPRPEGGRGDDGVGVPGAAPSPAA